MRFFVLLCLALTFPGCAEFSKFKVENDGTYRFKKEPFSVWAPNECLLDMFVYDTDHSVDFTTGRGYWMASGQYSLQIYPIPENIKDTKSFIEVTKDFMSKYMVEDRAPLGLTLKLKEEKQLEINGEAAYQAISVEEWKAVFIATSVLHNSRITVASLLYPDEDSTPAIEKIPWKCYNKFVNSIQEIK